jgi:hypothetical protein
MSIRCCHHTEFQRIKKIAVITMKGVGQWRMYGGDRSKGGGWKSGIYRHLRSSHPPQTQIFPPRGGCKSGIYRHLRPSHPPRKVFKIFLKVISSPAKGFQNFSQGHLNPPNPNFSPKGGVENGNASHPAPKSIFLATPLEWGVKKVMEGVYRRAFSSKPKSINLVSRRAFSSKPKFT